MRNRYFLLVLTLTVIAGPAFAINMSGFKDAPLTRLSAEEVTQFRAAVMKTLDTAPDGATIEWKAPKTPFVSKITPLKSYTEGKNKCRNVTIESAAKDRSERGTYSFCKPAGGEWSFSNSPAK